MTEVHGYVAPGFEPVRDAFAANLAEERGAAFAAMRDGETLVDLWGGWQDRLETKPWAQDTMTPVHSTTKAIAAIVMAWIVDQGLLSYDDRVSALWPEFANGKEDVTVEQALSHQAGVPGFAEPVDPMIWLDPPACAAAIAALAPMWRPGTASGYHPQTWGYIAGEIAQRASGRSLGAILREEMCAPNGIDFRIGDAEVELHRIAMMEKPKRIAEFGEITPIIKAAFFQPWSAPNKGGDIWRTVEIPSANGHGTARAIAQLFAIYANDGALEGAPLLSREAFGELTKRRIFGQDLVLPFRIDWRTGVMGNSNLFYGPNEQAFGHSGAGGSCGFGDPVTRISAGYIMNKQSHHLMGDPRALRLIEALYACA